MEKIYNKKFSNSDNDKKKPKRIGLKIFLGGMIILGSGNFVKLIKENTKGSPNIQITFNIPEPQVDENQALAEAAEVKFDKIEQKEINEYREYVEEYYGDLSSNIKDAIVKVGTLLSYDMRVSENTEEAEILSKKYNDYYSNEGEASLNSLETGKGICYNYTEIFNAIINSEENMEAYDINGTSNNEWHTWSLVKDEYGQYQQVDMTWIDSIKEEIDNTNAINRFINLNVLHITNKTFGDGNKELPDHELTQSTKELVKQVIGQEYREANVIIKGCRYALKVINPVTGVIIVAIYAKHQNNKRKYRIRSQSL